MRHLIVMNPAAGRGRSDRTPEAVAEALRRRGLDVETAVTSRPGEGREILATRGADYEGIVVVGGDGSLHDVVQGLDLERHRLGLIPWGTGNDFAWMTRWPADLEACAGRIAAGGERRVDLGSVRADLAMRTAEMRFHNNVGLGFEALVNRESQRTTRRKGPLLYALALARSLPRFRNYEVRLAWDGGSYEGRAALLMVGNGRRVGGAFLLAPGASVEDGRLDLVYAGGLGVARMMALLPRTLKGGHLRSGRVRTERITRLTVEAPAAIPAYVDGEFLDRRARRLEVTVRPGALRTF